MPEKSGDRAERNLMERNLSGWTCFFFNPFVYLYFFFTLSHFCNTLPAQSRAGDKSSEGLYSAMGLIFCGI